MMCGIPNSSCYIVKDLGYDNDNICQLPTLLVHTPASTVPRPSTSTAARRMEATDENEELRRFREDWKREVVARKRADTVLSWSSLSSTTNDQQAGLISEPSYDDHSPLWPSNLASAVEMYAEAVALEEQGLLDAATQLYKRAFAVDSNVHKAYDQAVKFSLEPQPEPGKSANNLAKRVQNVDVGPGHASDGVGSKEKHPEGVRSDARALLDKSRRKMAHLSNLTLPDANGLSFMPPPRLPPSSDAAVPNQPTDPAVLNALTPIRTLPDELLIHTLLFLIESSNSRHSHHHHRSNSSAVTLPDIGEDEDSFAAPNRHDSGMMAASNGATSIERFARVCWKARILTLDVGIWRSVGRYPCDNRRDGTTFRPTRRPRNEGVIQPSGLWVSSPVYTQSDVPQ